MDGLNGTAPHHRVADTSGMRIGFDIGGTKIAAIALDDEGSEIARHRVPVPRAYDGVVKAIEKTVVLLSRNGGKPQIGRAHV